VWLRDQRNCRTAGNQHQIFVNLGGADFEATACMSRGFGSGRRNKAVEVGTGAGKWGTHNSNNGDRVLHAIV
jgi:hypothetical protein